MAQVVCIVITLFLDYQAQERARSVIDQLHRILTRAGHEDDREGNYETEKVVKHVESGDFKES